MNKAFIFIVLILYSVALIETKKDEATKILKDFHPLNFKWPIIKPDMCEITGSCEDIYEDNLISQNTEKEFENDLDSDLDILNEQFYEKNDGVLVINASTFLFFVLLFIVVRRIFRKNNADVEAN